jgi:hypothetical protein
MPPSEVERSPPLVVQLASARQKGARDRPGDRYAEWHCAGLPVDTAITEGSANFLVNCRMNKSQQMRWSRSGAYLLLQVRSVVHNGTLGFRLRAEIPASQRSWPGASDSDSRMTPKPCDGPTCRKPCTVKSGVDADRRTPRVPSRGPTLNGPYAIVRGSSTSTRRCSVGCGVAVITHTPSGASN